MRLTSKEQEIIKKTIREIFGECEIYLFGSRLLDEKRGGDIDLYVIPKDRDNLLQKRLLALYRLKKRLYKPVDLVVHRNFKRHIEKEARKGVQL